MAWVPYLPCVKFRMATHKSCGYLALIPAGADGGAKARRHASASIKLSHFTQLPETVDFGRVTYAFGTR